MKTIQIRPHHVQGFLELISNPEYIKEFLKANGKELDENKLEQLMENVTEATEVKIVSAKDDICAICSPSLKKKLFGCWMPDKWGVPMDAEIFEPGKTYSISELTELNDGYMTHLLNTDFKKYRFANFISSISERVSKLKHD